MVELVGWAHIPDIEVSLARQMLKWGSSKGTVQIAASCTECRDTPLHLLVATVNLYDVDISLSARLSQPVALDLKG